MKLVFVYGTLKRGGSNHRLLAGQRFLGPAVTANGLCLYDLGGYPGMVEEPGGSEPVSGEVWSVDDRCLAELDELEGTAEGLYHRAEVPLLPPFTARGVEAYFYLRTVAGRARLGTTWDCAAPGNRPPQALG